MGINALPDKLRYDKNPDAWKGTDNASWLMRLKKKIQSHLALGPRDGSAREFPIILFARRGLGVWRRENSKVTVFSPSIGSKSSYKFFRDYSDINLYLSRIQCWCRWHIALQWPLFFQCHIFWKKQNVVKYPDYKSDFGLKKLFNFHIGYKRDADKVYWPTMFIGGNFE